MTGWRVFLATVMVAGCGSESADRFPTGSQTVAASEDGGAIYAVNPEEGTLSRVDVASGEVRTLAVGAWPSRVARVGDRLFVTLQGEAGLAVVEDRGGVMAITSVQRTGAEPVGVVASRDGARLYVAVTLEDAVEERDAVSLEVLRRFAVQDQPTWLALHPSEDALFVGSAIGGTVSRVDLESGQVSPVDLPDTERDNGDEIVDLDVRVTGDPAITPDGDSLAVPVLYVDDTTPVDEPDGTDGTVEPVPSGYGSSGGMGVSRLNPAIVTYDLDRHGEIVEGSAKAVFLGVQTTLREGDATSSFTIATSSSTGGERPEDVKLDPAVRSMPTSVAARPDGKGWIVTMEGSDAALLVWRDGFDAQGDEPSRFGGDVDFGSTDVATCVENTGTTDVECVMPPPFVEPSRAGFWDRPVVVLQAGLGARGVAFTGRDSAFVHNGVARTVGPLSLGDADALMPTLTKELFTRNIVDPGPEIAIEESALTEDEERGRRLFFSAVDARMAAFGAGVSCSTCHYQGRSDGIVWTFADGPRNTMNLAGGVAETAPFTWEGGVASVSEEAFLTSQGRMGGQDITDDDLAAIEAYVATLRPVDAPVSGDVTLGAKVFAQAGCTECHAGASGTDNAEHLVFAFPAQTPTLRGIAATAPYFHDGSAPTLRAVLEFSRSGLMGDTSALTDEEMAALEAYLRSL